MLGTALTMAHRAVNQADWFYCDNVERVVLMLPKWMSLFTYSHGHIYIHIPTVHTGSSYTFVVPLPLVWNHPGSRITPREPALCSHLTPSRRMFGNTHGNTIGATSATVMGLWTQAFSWPKNTLDLEGWDNCCSLEVTICLSEVGDWWWLFIVGQYL